MIYTTRVTKNAWERDLQYSKLATNNCLFENINSKIDRYENN